MTACMACHSSSSRDHSLVHEFENQLLITSSADNFLLSKRVFLESQEGNGHLEYKDFTATDKVNNTIKDRQLIMNSL